MQIIYGTEIAKTLKEDIKKRVEALNFKDKPKLAVILIGDNPASISYVKGKEKALYEVGMDFELFKYPYDVESQIIEDKIKTLNNDDSIDGILIQLPISKHLDQKKLLNMIDPLKDVDGLHPLNAGKLFLGEEGFVPCTPLGIMAILKAINCDLNGKDVVVIGRSNLVGLPIARLLIKENATVTICHSKTKDLKGIASKADILIVAIGSAKFINHEYIKDGAIVIDVGVNRLDGKLCGDVDFDDVKDKVAYITPVPKGVGPLTITMLLENTLKAYKRKKGL